MSQSSGVGEVIPMASCVGEVTQRSDVPWAVVLVRVTQRSNVPSLGSQWMKKQRSS